MEEVKKQCAKLAADFIQDHQLISLGGGQTIQYLIEEIKDKDIQVISPSTKTMLAAKAAGLVVWPTYMVDHVDWAFDGCDEVDEGFHALKSGGGIHTQEKIIASMADRYMVLIDSTKYVSQLSYQKPICVECVESAYAYVCKSIKQLGYRVMPRTLAGKDGFVATGCGILLDVWMDSYVDPVQVQHQLKSICGVIETSLFIDEITDIFYVQDGKAIHNQKPKD